MDFLSAELQQYMEAHTEPESDQLHSIDRDTHLHVMMPRMLSGHLQGRVLSMLSHMIKPKNVLEIGTYTGYSAICIAEGMLPDGKLVTLDSNEELESRIRTNLASLIEKGVVDFLVGNAVELIPTLDMIFDMVFIDADKLNYSTYFDLVIDKVPTGGYILADNVLWSGKVIDEEVKSTDKDTPAIRAFNEKVHRDSRVANVLFPVRDGIMILRKL